VGAGGSFLGMGGGRGRAVAELGYVYVIRVYLHERSFMDVVLANREPGEVQL
jgi:hypothetical protein